MAYRPSRNSIRTTLGTLALGAALSTGITTASASPAALDPISTTPATTASIASEGTGSSGSAYYPGSVLCWLLSPSPTCQI